MRAFRLAFSPFVLALCLSFFATLVANGQNSLEQSWLQFGHGSNWSSPYEFDSGDSIKREWSIEIGDGRAQIVGTEGELYVASGTATKIDNQTNLTTRLKAIDCETGETKWVYEIDSTMHEPQESFGGATAAPQATPAIAGQCLISVSFAGQLVCLNRADGSLRWKKDLVEDVGAEPVQFGFSSSPVVDPAQPDRVYVLAPGKQTGFYCLSVDDGSVIWKAECSTCGYATPVNANFGGVKQWIIVSEDELLGVSADNGTRLWRFELPETGLTNVPTPIVVDDTQLVISGQGSQGSRCLAITKPTDDWKVDEKWHNPKLLFFYTNWIKLNDQVIVGCTDKYLAAFDVNDGSILGRWRGYGNGNLVIANQNLLVLDGKGSLSVFEPILSPESAYVGLVASGKYKVIDGRCWTPISIVANRILIRADDQLACITVGKSGQETSTIENLLSTQETLEFTQMVQPETADPVARIFATFESKGPDSAMLLYAELRSEKVLDEKARIELAEAAQEQGLADLAKLIISHAVEDYPDSKAIESAAQRIRDK